MQWWCLSSIPRQLLGRSRRPSGLHGLVWCGRSFAGQGRRWCELCICIFSIVSNRIVLFLPQMVSIDWVYEQARDLLLFENLPQILPDSNLEVWFPRIDIDQWLCIVAFIASSLHQEDFFLNWQELCSLNLKSGHHRLPCWWPSRVWGRAAFLDCWFGKTCASICLATFPDLARQDWATLEDFGRLIHIQNLGVHQISHQSFHQHVPHQYFVQTFLNSIKSIKL